MDQFFGAPPAARGTPGAPGLPVGPELPPEGTGGGETVSPAGEGLPPVPVFVPRIGREEVLKATQILLKYKGGKAHLEARIKSSEAWWKLRHWDEIRSDPGEKKPVSAWLSNVIVGKHADAVEAYPEPSVLPREEGDAAEAEKLSAILPVVLEQNDFQETYSDAAWQKMKSGTAIYGVFWDGAKLNGLGDIAIRRCDALNLFWKPGVSDIEDSPHLFFTATEDNEALTARYPQLTGKLLGNSLLVSQYAYDDHADPAESTTVVDWYYKKRVGNKTVLHYCKFVGETVLYASENVPELSERGFYDDGAYPFVFDRLFPVEGSPCGYGYIDIGKSPQEAIDKLNQAILKNALMASNKRYFIRTDGALNEEEFADWSKPFVHVNGNLGADSIKPIDVPSLDSIYVSILQSKVEELKFTSGNMDVSNGASPSGVTAASAIAALQESAGRSSRAATKSAYRAYARLIGKVIERIRQFYDLPRTFRILGEEGVAKYVSYSNTGIRMHSQGQAFGQDLGMRLPVFDIQVTAAKANPYTKIAQNELALQFYQLGFYNPKLADQALMALKIMDFDGKDGVIQQIGREQTARAEAARWQQMALALAQKYEPELARGLAQKAMQEGGGAPLPIGADIRRKDPQEETAQVRRSRERAGSAGLPR